MRFELESESELESEPGTGIGTIPVGAIPSVA